MDKNAVAAMMCAKIILGVFMSNLFYPATGFMSNLFYPATGMLTSNEAMQSLTELRRWLLKAGESLRQFRQRRKEAYLWQKDCPHYCAVAEFLLKSPICSIQTFNRTNMNNQAVTGSFRDYALHKQGICFIRR